MTPENDPDEKLQERELRQADILLEKADAFLQRHHRRAPEAADEDVLEEKDDLPILTEVIERGDEARFDDSLEAALEQRIEEWFAAELPRMLEREMHQASRRLRHEALARMRTHLMPELAATIERHLAEKEA